MVLRNTPSNETIRVSSRDTCRAHRETVLSALAQRSDRTTTRPAGYILLYSNQHDSIVNKLIFASTSRSAVADVDVDRGLFDRRSIYRFARHPRRGACCRKTH